MIRTSPTGVRRTRIRSKRRRPRPGVVDYAYRYYDPMTGRWPSRDPIGTSKDDLGQVFLGGSLLGAITESLADFQVPTSGNEYLSMKNSPTTRIDRFGLLCCWVCTTGWETISVGHVFYPLALGHPRYGISVYYSKVERCAEKQIGTSPCTGIYTTTSRVGSFQVTSPSLFEIVGGRNTEFGQY